MRNSRFLLPFTLGAISMLVLVIAAGWAATGVLGRVPAVLGFGVSSPGGAAEMAAAPIASAVPFVGVAPPDARALAAAPVAALRLLVPPVPGVNVASLVDTYE